MHTHVGAFTCAHTYGCAGRGRDAGEYTHFFSLINRDGLEIEAAQPCKSPVLRSWLLPRF